MVKTCIYCLTMMVLVVFFSACGGEDSYVPKPRIFPKIELEAKYYTQVKSDDLHARFELPGYAVIKQDSQNAAPRQGWANIIYKPYDATLHLTHYSFQQWSLYDSLVQDTRKLVYKHLQRAEDIVEEPVSVYGSKQWGLVYRIKGNTATNLNFFITDSARNFVRGALYFNHATNPDSIAPVYDYIEQDIFHMIKTFQWQ
jgi:gliding motility-associated lipoprotein GldD